MPPTPDFAFPQQLSREVAPPDGCGSAPSCHLHRESTPAAAPEPHPPQPTPPLLRYLAKLTMALEAMISLVIIGLVIARAVNILK